MIFNICPIRIPLQWNSVIEAVFQLVSKTKFKTGSVFILILIYQFPYFVCEGARPLCYSKHKPLLLGATPNQLGGVAWKSILWERRPASGFLLQMLTLQHVSFIAVILVSYIHNVSLQTPANKRTLTQFCTTGCYSQQFTRSLTREHD